MLKDATAGKLGTILTWREDRLYRGMRAMLLVLELIQTLLERSWGELEWPGHACLVSGCYSTRVERCQWPVETVERSQPPRPVVWLRMRQAAVVRLEVQYDAEHT